MKFLGLWDRLLLRRLFTTVVAFLVCFFFLYILIDFASRVSSIESMRKSPELLFRYYGAVFIKRLEVLLPFALMLGTIRSLQILYRERGFVAGLTSGIPIKRLLRPFYLLGFVSLVLLLASEQWFVPYALKEINWIESLHFKGKGLGQIHQKLAVQTEEGGRLFFSSINPFERTLTDVYYLPSWEEMLHLEKLDLSESIPQGSYVDFFKKDENSNWILSKREPHSSLPTLLIEWEELFGLVAQPNQLPLMTLIQKVSHLKGISPLEKGDITTTLSKKLLFPSLPWLVILAVIPIGISFSRGASFLTLYGGALFLFLSLYLSLNALQIPSSPWLLIVPFLSLASLVLFRQFRFHGTL